MATTALTLLASFAPGALQTNIQIPNTRFGTVDATPADEADHPHQVDVYRPEGEIRCVMVALHGGGGNKTQYAASLGVLRGDPPTYAKINWALLEKAKCALIVPTGQRCTGVDAAWGAGNNPWNPDDVDPAGDVRLWSSGVFWSGYDDPQFLRDCVAYILDQFGSTPKRVLVGHSAGGMMVHRMWWEHDPAAGYDCYFTSSATPSMAYSGATAPVDAMPCGAIFGANDVNLGIDGGNIGAATLELTVNPTTAWTSWPDPPQLMGPLVAQQARVDAYNTQHSLAPETVDEVDGVTVAAGGTGTRTDWNNSDGNMLTRELSDADHSNTSQQDARGQKQIIEWSLFAQTH